jgi:hypothetical protein
MTIFELRSFLPPTANRLRLVSGGGVLLLHGLVAIALLLHLRATRPLAPPAPSMQVLMLKPERPVVVPQPITPTRSFTPPAASLTSPVFMVAPREQRGITVPEAPAPVTPGAAPAGPVKPGDLFSEEKKKEFKAFFKQQAIEDARENAKSSGRDGCNVFRDKPGEQPKVDMQTNTGITRDFVPAFGVGTESSGDDNGHMHACN